MIRNYIVIAIRKIFTNWIQSSINLFGLVVGIASSLLIFSYVSHEMHYDSFHEDSERIFKVGGTLSYGGNEFNLFGFSPGFGNILQESDKRIEAISLFADCDVLSDWCPELNFSGSRSKSEIDELCEQFINVSAHGYQMTSNTSSLAKPIQIE